MSDPQRPGLSITYVTDPDLDMKSQQRVLQEFVACAADQTLRVAFRLPSACDTEVTALFDWYRCHVDREGLGSLLEPPLIHSRPDIRVMYPEASLWLPYCRLAWATRAELRNRHMAVSIHGAEEAQEALAGEANELIFGHVFASESHPGEPGRGVAAFNEIAVILQEANTPLLLTAIGGVNQHTISEIGRGHHDRVAVIRAVSQAPDIAQTLKQMRSIWMAARINSELAEHQQAPFGRPASFFFR